MRRPPDKPRAAHEFLTSNNTLKAFLGGRQQKSWMTASNDVVQPTPRAKITPRPPTESQPTHDVLPSPVSSEEPSPAHLYTQDPSSAQIYSLDVCPVKAQYGEASSPIRKTSADLSGTNFTNLPFTTMQTTPVKTKPMPYDASPSQQTSPTDKPQFCPRSPLGVSPRDEFGLLSSRPSSLGVNNPSPQVIQPDLQEPIETEPQERESNLQEESYVSIPQALGVENNANTVQLPPLDTTLNFATLPRASDQQSVGSTGPSTEGGIVGTTMDGSGSGISENAEVIVLSSPLEAPTEATTSICDTGGQTVMNAVQTTPRPPMPQPQPQEIRTGIAQVHNMHGGVASNGYDSPYSSRSNNPPSLPRNMMGGATGTTTTFHRPPNPIAQPDHQFVSGGNPPFGHSQATNTVAAPITQSPYAVGRVFQPTTLDLSCLLPKLDQYIRSRGGEQSFSPMLERPRFTLLRDACSRGDGFYVLLHQVFCLWTIEPDQLALFEGFRHTPATAFRVLNQLIRDNQDLPQRHLVWFITFPLPWAEVLGQAQLCQILSKIAGFLNKLEQGWANLSASVLRRGYPPLLEEFVHQLELTSPVMQGIMFSACRRNLGAKDGQIGEAVEKLFGMDRMFWMSTATESYDALFRAKLENHTKSLVHRYLGLIYNRRQSEHSIPLNPVPNQSRSQQNIAVPLSVNISHQPQPSPMAQLSPVYSPPPVASGPSPESAGSMQSPGLPLSLMSPQVAQQPGYSTMRAPSHSSQSLPSPGLSASFQRLGYQSPVNQEHAGFNGNTPSLIPHSPLPVTVSGLAPSQMMPSENPGAAQVPYPYPYHQQQVQTQPYSGQDPRSAGSSQPSPTTFPIGEWFPAQLGPVSPVYPIPPNHPLSMMPNYLVAWQQSREKTASQQSPVIRQNNSFSRQAQLKLQRHLSHGGASNPVYMPKASQPMQQTTASGEPSKLYQVVKEMVLLPMPLSPANNNQEMIFRTREVDRMNLAKSGTGVKPPVRQYWPGSTQFRLRCIEIKSLESRIPVSDWVVTETNWPVTIVVQLNGRLVEIKRKMNQLKDLPVDIGHCLNKHGSDNRIRVTIPRPSKNEKRRFFAVGVELIETLDHARIMATCDAAPKIPALKTLNSIISSMSGQDDDDDDFAMVVSDLTIDVTDPFMAKIWDIPARGNGCVHRECFDLHTFLSTRNSNPKNQHLPCSPDVWKCPLCNKDARPDSLVIDEFLVRVRESLEKQNKLDCKAIIVSPDGTWKAKPEVISQSRKRKASAMASDDEDGDDHFAPGPVAAPEKQKEVVIIDLD